MGNFPALPDPNPSAPGTSSGYPPILGQILQNQIAMQRQITELDREQHAHIRRQRKMEYKLNQYFIRIGFSVDSPPTTSTDD